MMNNKFFNILIDFFFPTKCMFCDCIIPYDQYYCERCKKEVKVGGFINTVYLNNCNTLIFALDYHFACKAVYKLKFKHEITAMNGLAYFLLEAIKQNLDINKIDIVIASPMYVKKGKRFEYNHAEFLAAAVANQLNLCTSNDVLCKIKKTKKQHKSNQKLRLNNLNGAFKVYNQEKIIGKTVLFIDDVFTTGSTVSECSTTLINAGAKKVIAACATKTTFVFYKEE